MHTPLTHDKPEPWWQRCSYHHTKWSRLDACFKKK